MIADILEDYKRDDVKAHGVFVGLVTNNKDPDKLGRVKVKLPRLGDDHETDWTRIATLMGGKERGTFFLPEVDDEVLVVFEHGDINMPYVIGALWNGKDKPPETNSDGKNDLRVIKSRSGHVVKFNDKSGSETIEIIDKSEKNKITIDTKNNKITIEADKDIDIKAGSGKLALSGNEVEIKSSAGMKIEAGSSLDVQASSSIKAKGATITLN